MAEDVTPVHGIAIIGMAGRFPGAPDLATYWRNLREGKESTTVFERDELARLGIPEALLNDPAYVRARGTLAGVEQFDAGFFSYSPREATIMDPQQRLFLECSWEALESAGYDPKRFSGLIGVYGGATSSSYMPLVYADPQTVAQSDPLSIAIGNEIAFLTTRVSYKLDLRGPSCPVQTACSTSLVAVHLACQGLLNAECDLALAGAVSIRVPQTSGYLYQPSGILSPDGHCRPFDANAQGTLFSNGIGIVLLKRLDDALEDGDVIHAVIRGSAINNDGSQKASFTAPAVGGQAEVVADALSNADVEPQTISYLEAHGTATSLGDSIELQALNRVFPTDTGRHYCALGSVKSNFGHLDAAAGIAGLIKTVLAMQHGELPPSLHFEQPNPDVDFDQSAFYVNARLAPWSRRDGVPRRAGVSSFGFGGTNAHVVLEEAPETAGSGPSREWQVLTISADSDAGLETATTQLADALASTPGLPLADVAYTLAVGRRAFRHRRAVIGRSRQELLGALETRDAARMVGGAIEGAQRPVVFMFPGQGAQHVNMARELYDSEPVFRDTVDQCASGLRAPLGLDLRDVLYPSAADDPAAMERLRHTANAQPALFVVEYALARLWMEWGVQPDACIGHSIGEYVAACLAGVFSLEDALRLVAARGALMGRMPEGGMLAIGLPEERVGRYLAPGLWLSVVNGPASCVVSGETPALTVLAQRLTAEGVTSQLLHTSHAFHSGMMDAAVHPFVTEVGAVRLSPPKLPYLSNVSGQWADAAQVTRPAYWGEQLRQPVRFSQGVAALLERDDRVYLEVGPGQTLSTLVRQQGRGRGGQLVFPTLRHARQAASDLTTAATSLGRLWVSGAEVNWSTFYRGQRRARVSLPTYPFDRQRYWVNPVVPRSHSKAASGRSERQKGKIAEIDRWFFRPTWARSPLTAAAEHAPAEGTWIVLADAAGLGAAIVAKLRDRQVRALLVERGNRFEPIGTEDHYRIDPAVEGHLRSVIELADQERGPVTLLHLWNLDAAAGDDQVSRFFAEARDAGFGTLLRLARALGSTSMTTAGPVSIGVVTRGAHDVTGDEALSPGNAISLGLSRVIPQEYPELGCRTVDLDRSGTDATARERSADALVRDFATGGAGQATVAYRHGHRWALDYAQTLLPAMPAATPHLRQRGVYLITGGLGDIGLHFAEYLAREAGARLVLTGRTGVPPQERWDAHIASYGRADPISRQLRRLQRIVEAGGEVLVVQADAADRLDMLRTFASAEARFGPVNGVIHAAGLVVGDAFRPIAETDEEVCRRQFAPKVNGTCVLDEILRTRPVPPDFVVLVSSLSSVLGGLRFAAYASANAFLDTFAAARARTGQTTWLSVNWDSWARGDEPPMTQPSANAPAMELVMTGLEGVEAMHRIFVSGIGPQVLVSTGDLHARLEQWVALKAVHDDLAAPTSARHPRPNLQTEYVAPQDPLEIALASIWQELLGIERLGVHDSFFELGGDSLLGVQVIARIKKQLAASVSAVSLYEGPTVALLANVIRATASPELDESRTRGDRRRDQKLRRQLQSAG